jgi:predicted ATPase
MAIDLRSGLGRGTRSVHHMTIKKLVKHPDGFYVVEDEIHLHPVVKSHVLDLPANVLADGCDKQVVSPALSDREIAELHSAEPSIEEAVEQFKLYKN